MPLSARKVGLFVRYQLLVVLFGGTCPGEVLTIQTPAGCLFPFGFGRQTITQAVPGHVLVDWIALTVSVNRLLRFVGEVAGRQALVFGSCVAPLDCVVP